MNYKGKSNNKRLKVSHVCMCEFVRLNGSHSSCFKNRIIYFRISSFHKMIWEIVASLRIIQNTTSKWTMRAIERERERMSAVAFITNNKEETQTKEYLLIETENKTMMSTFISSITCALRLWRMNCRGEWQEQNIIMISERRANRLRRRRRMQSHCIYLELDIFTFC